MVGLYIRYKDIDLLVLFSTKDRVWKLADFGLTCETTSNTFERSEFARGTTGYRAPELLNTGNYKYNTKVDMWGMGCILFELVVGRKPFSSDWAVRAHFQSGKDIDVDTSTSITFSKACMNQFSHIIRDLLQLDPKSRPSAQDFLDEFTVQSSVGTHRMRRPTSNGEEEFGQMETVISLPPLSVSLPDSKRLDHKKWAVSSVAINQSNTRAVSLDCNHLFTKIRVALWDTTTGAMLWSSEEPINPRFISNQHPVPAFSEGGEYLVAYV